MTQLFGTNGIRGIVNEEMHGKLALNIGKAWGTFLKKTNQKPRLVVGTDARLSNHMLKAAIASGLLATGCDVVDIGLVPTPTVQYMVKKNGFDSGVIITASHNPPQFNGIKGIEHTSAEFPKTTEESIEHIYFKEHYTMTSWDKVGTYTFWDGALTEYLQGILSQVDSTHIKQHRFHVVLDCGNGAGSVITPHLLEQLGCTVTTLFCEPDGRFPGRPSEPLPENLACLIQTVRDEHATFGIAQDGDADRAIFIDDHGNYLWGDSTLTLVAQHMIHNNTNKKVVTPVTTSTCFEETIMKNQGQVIYTPVGSPMVAHMMLKQHAVFGGEENGGLIFPSFHYGRDSTMTLAKILEILAIENHTLSELVHKIPRYEIFKTKISCPNNKKTLVMQNIINKMKNDTEVEKIDRTDGIKIFTTDGWVLMRPSGTEPLFRVYAESKQKTTAENMIRKYKQFVEKILTSSP